MPVPADIPPERYTRTTVRIQHLGGATERRRRERFRKYVEADPLREWQPGYRDLLAREGPAKPWEPRAPDLPMVLEHIGDAFTVAGLPSPDADLDLESPALSAVVIARDDEERIERVLRSVCSQDVPEPIEIIVVVSGHDWTARIVLEQFPEATLVELDRPALPGEARNAGLAVARGDYVSFPPRRRRPSPERRLAHGAPPRQPGRPPASPPRRPPHGHRHHAQRDRLRRGMGFLFP